ncbi:hypothetical protein CY34DRAFT_454653 [Suillus luteus UH-Slu-Lm8-n1]|uniref:Uncharacterized protein n=1 Tax=Suillus luteus UH-Slu-Lm8-n1 TaxID=930992 RepID=A0A0D0B0A3_9AGAM|nr:hypothetical protein CY34DRAFT_454653 [Suillus luteus UH-Slu-Lm8-n1]
MRVSTKSGISISDPRHSLIAYLYVLPTFPQSNTWQARHLAAIDTQRVSIDTSKHHNRPTELDPFMII